MKVLVLGSGGAASNGFARALRLAGGYELVGTNCSETDLWLSECETNHLVAPVSDFDAWRVDLHRVIQTEKPDFVHAQNDAEVRALAHCRSLVHMLGCKTYLPSTETIELCQDKWLSYERWRDSGLTVPETKLCATVAAVSSMTWHSKHDKVWLRPRRGAGGQRSFVASSYTEAAWWLDRNHGWGEFTIAELLTPQSVTVQQLYWHGELVCSQQRTRESWANAGSTTTGVSGSTGVGVTSSHAEADRVADLAVAAVDAKPHGLYGVDMAYNEAGTPCPTEINIGRMFTTASEFFALASPNRAFNMAVRYVNIGTFQRTNGVPLGQRNPLPDGVRWIRGMDNLPVLVAA